MRPRNASWLDNSHRPLAAAAAALWCAAATASPEGGTFMYGDGTITAYGGGIATVVELIGPNRFVIGWNDFDVAAGESVVFNGVDFTALNTINAGAPSSSWMIDGTINAPGGEVWFVNPAGVMFGESAVLDVGGLLAAAGSIDTADFIAGNDVFNLSGDVSFAGTMSTANGLAHRAILLGHRVDNTGFLKGDIIAMAAGDTVRLIDLGSRITLELDGSMLDAATAATGTIASMDATAAIANHGRIETGNGGQVLLASGDALGAAMNGLAIEHDGEIVSAAGQVELIALDGAIRTDRSFGGGNAHVTTAGLIDVSDQGGAGTVALAGPSVVIGSSIRAQGGNGGGGGDVTVTGAGSVVLAGDDLVGWDNAAGGYAGTGTISVSGGGGSHDAGSISIDAGSGRALSSAASALTATGGVSGGDGGTIDVRGGELQWNGRARASAVSGSGGHIAWAATGAMRITTDGSLASADFGDLLAAASGDGFMGATLAQSLGYVDADMSIASGGRLTFETSIAGLPSDGPTRLSGDAIFSGSEILFADSSGATELRAGGALALLGDMTMVNSDAVLLSGQRDGVSGTELGGWVRATGEHRGTLDLSSPGAVHINGDIGLEGAEIGSLVLQRVGELHFVNGDRSILATGDVQLASMDGGPLAVSLAGDLQVRADGDIVFGEGLTIEGNASLHAQAGGRLENRAIAEVADDLTFIGGTLENHNALIVGDDLVLSATDGILSTTDAVTVGDSALLTGSLGVTLSAPLQTGGDLSVASSGGTVAIDAAIEAGGTVSLSAQQDVTSTADITATGADGDRGTLRIEAVGAIDLAGDLMAGDDDVELQAGTTLAAARVDAASLQAQAGSDVDFGDISTSGAVAATSGGDLHLEGQLTADDVQLSAEDLVLSSNSSITQTGTGGILIDSDAIAALEGAIDAEGALTVRAGTDLVVAGAISAATVSLAGEASMVLDGASVTSTETGLLGGTSLQLESPTIDVTGDSTITAQSGAMRLVGSDGPTDALAQVRLDDARLQMTAIDGPLLFIATADGDGDLSLDSQAELYIGGDLGSTSPLRSIDLAGANGLQLGGLVPLETTGQSFDVHTIRAENSVLLQATDLDTIAGGVASIHGFSDELAVTSLAGDIEIGRNQGFVQLGDLSMEAAGTIEVTDVTALGNLSLQAASLIIDRRGPMEILDADGTLVTSDRTSIVAGGDLLIDVGTLEFAGDGLDPLMGAMGTASGVPEGLESQPIPFDRADLILAGPGASSSLLLEWLELNADDPATGTDLIAAESQSTQSMPDLVLLEGNEDPVTAEALGEMGIVLRPLSEARGHASRLARPGEVTVDLVSGPGPARVGRVVVTRTRLLRRQVDLAVQQWRSAWDDGSGARELLVADAGTDDEAQTDDVRRETLKQRLRATYAHLRLAGLTPSEIDASRQFVINGLIAQGADADLAVSLLN